MSNDIPEIEPADEEAMQRLAAVLRLPGRADRALDARMAGFESRVLAALAEPEPGAPTEPGRRPWLLRPRTIHIRPLSALATAAALLVALVGGERLLQSRPAVVATPNVVGAQTPAVTPARDTVRLVQFVLLAPRAAQVQLAGDFNGWQGSATPLRRTASGLWAVELPLPPGRYTYTFVVDGSHFTPDPAAPRALVDDFGTPSSVVTVGGGNT